MANVALAWLMRSLVDKAREQALRGPGRSSHSGMARVPDRSLARTCCIAEAKATQQAFATGLY
jgi:hypothetical protein